MHISGLRETPAGGFVLELKLEGTPKKNGERPAYGLGTRDRSEAERIAALLKKVLSDAGHMRAGLTRGRGRPRKDEN